jgi:NADPH:quinone reductase-like Zn-dependent oxidoreductase
MSVSEEKRKSGGEKHKRIMKAVQIKSYGDPLKVLEIAEIPEPNLPGTNEALLGIEIVPLNKHDLLFIGNALGSGPALPTVVGNEGYGRVLAVGSGVKNVKVGDRVLAPILAGTWREKMIVPASSLFPLPDGDPHQFSMLGSNPPTAALILSEYTQLKKGDWVVQNSANSGVGRSLIAIAKARGLRTINFVRRGELINELKAAGGDVVLVDLPGAVEEALRFVGDGSVRLGVDGIGGQATNTLVQALSSGGVLVAYTAASGGPMAINPMPLIFKQLKVQGCYLGHFDFEKRVLPAQREAAPLVATGALYVPVAATYPLSRIKEAVTHLLRGGKILLEVQKLD